MIKYYKHPQGLASVNLIFEGSNIENSNQLGCAHLLEHLMCKKIKSMEEHEFDSHGIEFNAMTSPGFTQYYITGLDDKVQLFAQKFINKLTNTSFDFTIKEFEQEKQIILQEWEDTNFDVEKNLIQRFYQDHYKSPKTIGSRDKISNISYKEMKQFYEDYFKKPVYCLIEQSTKWKVKDISFKENHESPNIESTHNGKWFKNINNKSNQAMILISKPYDSNLIEHYMIMSMLCDGLFSPLLKSIREEKQLAYNFDGNLEFAGTNSVHTVFFTSSHKNNKNKIKNEFNKVLANKTWFNQKRFNQIKQKNIVEMEIMKKRGDISPLNDILFPSESRLRKDILTVTYKDLKKVIDFYTKNNFDLYT